MIIKILVDLLSVDTHWWFNLCFLCLFLFNSACWVFSLMEKFNQKFFTVYKAAAVMWKTMRVQIIKLFLEKEPCFIIGAFAFFNNLIVFKINNIRDKQWTEKKRKDLFDSCQFLVRMWNYRTADLHNKGLFHQSSPTLRKSHLLRSHITLLID